MTIPDLPEYQDLKQFHNPDNLAFRAACNGVLTSLAKPLKHRAIEHIHASPESQDILMRLWHSLGPVGPDVMATNLAGDLCWKTLVLEQVSRESQWKDIFDHPKLLDSAKSLYEKLWDGGSHPAAKTAATIVLTVAGYGAARTLAPNAMAIPFTTVWSDKTELPIRFTAAADGKLPPFQIQFLPPDKGAQIPVDLRIDSQERPIGIELAGSGAPGKAIQDVAMQLAVTSKSVANASIDLHQLSVHEAKVDPHAIENSIQQMANGVSNASTEITRISKQIALLQASLEATAADEEDATEARTAKLIGDLVVISHATQHGIASLTLRKGRSRAVALPYPDGEKGEISSRTVELTFEGTGQDKLGDYIVLRSKPEHGAESDPIHLYDGGSVQILDQPLYRASLNVRSRTWLGGQMAELTLAPQAEPQKGSNSPNSIQDVAQTSPTLTTTAQDPTPSH